MLHLKYNVKRICFRGNPIRRNLSICNIKIKICHRPSSSIICFFFRRQLVLRRKFKEVRSGKKWTCLQCEYEYHHMQKWCTPQHIAERFKYFCRYQLSASLDPRYHRIPVTFEKITARRTRNLSKSLCRHQSTSSRFQMIPRTSALFQNMVHVVCRTHRRTRSGLGGAVCGT